MFKLTASEEELKSIPPYSGIGFDAVGKIVDSNINKIVDNADEKDLSWNGKKVAVYQTFFSSEFSGTWREYLY